MGWGCGTTGCDAGAGGSTGRVWVLQMPHRSPLLGCCRGNTVILGDSSLAPNKGSREEKKPQGIGCTEGEIFLSTAKICHCLNQQRVLRGAWAGGMSGLEIDAVPRVGAGRERGALGSGSPKSVFLLLPSPLILPHHRGAAA